MLIDPDKPGKDLEQFVRECEALGVDAFLVGGSLLVKDDLKQALSQVKRNSTLPTYLFPSSPSQIDEQADGILFLSLISGRNPDLLIGKHVEAAPILKRSQLDVLSTGYMLVDCGNTTTAHYISQSAPLPYDKPEIAQATALAGELLGLSTIYMDGGSGAAKPVSLQMIEAVARGCDLPLIVGGGIRSAEQAEAACRAGADMIVIGTALEENPSLLADISIAVHAIEVS